MLKYFKLIGVVMGLLWLSGVSNGVELSRDNGGVLGHRAWSSG